MNAREDWQAYLSWQAEMGTEEVILAEPWKRKMAAPVKAVVPRNVFQIKEGPNFFQSISG